MSINTRLILVSLAMLYSITGLSEDEPILRLPPYHVIQKGPPVGTYPMQAARLQQQGRVLVQFDISADGRAKGVTVVSSEPLGVFDKSASGIVSAWAFDLPPDWSGSEASKHHFTLSVIYHLGACPSVSTCDGIEAYPSDAQMAVTLQLSGRPIQNHQ
jgi:TonB family protein